jgi:thioesterase DpgC
MAPALQAQLASPPPAPQFTGSFAQDCKLAQDYFQHAAAGSDGSAEYKQALRDAKEVFFRRHAAAIYDAMTDNCSKALRLNEIAYGAADRFPGILPTRAQIAGERALKKQIAKEGLEIDQGLFIAHVLADPRCGMHLVHAMLRPKKEAEQLLPEFKRTGKVTIGDTTAERKGFVGTVTHGNTAFLNAEDDGAMANMETAVDLVLMDERIQVGVLRGGVLNHPKYPGKRIFNAGINLTHLYYGQISLIEFILERELGLLNKLYRGHSRPGFDHTVLEDVDEKPWLGVVESFAIGGGCQLLCVLDRVIAEPGAYFNLPASKEGFIPGSSNLRLPNLVGIQKARHGIFFEKKFYAGTPEGMMICDEVVEPANMEAAIERTTKQMVAAGFTSTVSNRKALRVGQETWDVYRRYMAVYSRQQAFCFYDQALISNLEHSWKPQTRRM